MLYLRAFLRDIPAVIGLITIVTLCVIAILAPHIIPRPDEAFNANVFSRLQPPSADYPFGTDNLGRDILSRVILGTRSALGAALLVVAGAIVIGVPLGLYAGYTDGVVSNGIMRVTDIFLAVPQLVLALAVAQIFTAGLGSAMLALALTFWPFFTRSVYSETRRVRSAMYVDALEGLGASRLRILGMHILPNVAGPIIVRASTSMGFTILLLATLGFLGAGATPPDPDWGLAIAESRQYLPDAWWMPTFPGLAIFIAVLGFSFFGDGLLDLVDPKQRRSR